MLTRIICNIFVRYLSAILFCTLFFHFNLASANEPKKVAVAQLVEHPAFNFNRFGILDELREAGYDPNTNLTWQYDCAQGNAVLAAQIAEKLVAGKPNAIVAIGTNSAQSVISAARNAHIPIIFTAVTDPLGAKLVKDLKKPQGDITGVSDQVSTSEQFSLFKSILPNLKSLGIIYNPGEPNSVALLKEQKKVAKSFKIDLIFATATRSSEVPSAADALSSKVQAIFIDNDNTALSAFKAIVATGNRTKTPVFCSDTDMVELGALAALGPNQRQLGRQTGKMVIKILSGMQPKDIPVEFPSKLELHLNADQARILNIKFNPKLLANATSVFQQEGQGRSVVAKNE